MGVEATPNKHEAQRRRTRERVLDAAIVEFRRAGAAAADINAVVKAAGVSRGTFYFHFPTREHVLHELICREEARVAAELGTFLDSSRDLAAVLKQIVRLVVDLENRWGSALFRDVIGLYFSPTRPENDEWTDHPTIVLLAAEIVRARNRGEVFADVDAFHSAVFFLLGLYALVTTMRSETPGRDGLLDKYVARELRSLRAEVPSPA
ncbi:TetR/AcrR family transcriptional regulator [Mycobacterium sp. 236(2023)]|uniref:TetR/AcrR family transcriptional regulator n=1 Tax=Mycobacterium sp. 236(2023) TaxID=3038163 RepID=UPI00241526AB|nr:TetR/AcrR family transcriptional regulator [Mycobacterium sp. 236(2023)]MDG4664359.1 TetR/AcrR family transcriptional regulator [Mycobacterium sp. 236(2023)]